MGVGLSGARPIPLQSFRNKQLAKGSILFQVTNRYGVYELEEFVVFASSTTHSVNIGLIDAKYFSKLTAQS